MRILTRYILKEVASHAAIGGAIFTFVLFIRYLPHLLEMIVRNSASLGSVFEIVALTLPDMCTVTIPMAVLVGILLGLSRLAADSEITAMRASGIGVWSFVRIVGLVAVVAWGASLWNALYLAPRSAAAMIRLENSLANRRLPTRCNPASSTKTLRTTSSTSRTFVPAPAPPTGAASSSPMSPTPTPPGSPPPIAPPSSTARTRP